MKERNEDYQRAIEASQWGKCISRDYFEVVVRGKPYRARIVRRSGRDYAYVFASSPSIEIKGIYPCSSDIDRVREWEAF